MMTTLCFFASFVNASVLGPGIVSATLKKRWSSTWQKYCERYISCVQMICAPPLAARSIRRVWLARFSRASSEHAICVRPTCTVCAAFDDADDDDDDDAAPFEALREVRFFMVA